MFTDLYALSLYTFLTIAANIIALIVRTYMRKLQNNFDSEPPSLSIYEMAYLANGQIRAIDTAIANLVERGYLLPDPKTRSLKLQTVLPKDCDPLEKSILLLAKFNGSLSQMRTSVAHATFPIYKRLVDLGLLVPLEQAQNVQLLSALPVLTILLAGMGMTLWRISQNQAVGLLILLCAIAAISSCSFLFIPVRRSWYGDRILKHLRTHCLHLPPTTNVKEMVEPQLIMTFALFGAKVLGNTSLNNFREVLTPHFHCATVLF